QDVSDRYSNDAELCKTLEVAEALGTLDLKEMDDGLRRRIMGALRAVAMDTIEGTIAGWRPPTRRSTRCIVRRCRNWRNALRARTISARGWSSSFASSSDNKIAAAILR